MHGKFKNRMKFGQELKEIYVGPQNNGLSTEASVAEIQSNTSTISRYEKLNSRTQNEDKLLAIAVAINVQSVRYYMYIMIGW